MSRQLRSISVRDLRDLLKDEDDDTLVIFSADYGDYHHTRQALPLKGDVESVLVEESGYSNSGFAIVEDDHDRGDDGETEYTPYLLIS